MRYSGPVCRQCRREGEKLFLKGDKCFSTKCPITTRNYPPGHHGQGRRGKTSDFGKQLRAKQKCRRIYNVSESVLAKYFNRARVIEGKTGDNLLKILEMRMDNIAYKSGLCASRPQARVAVTHGHFFLNGRRVDIPSIMLKPGDVIELREKNRKSKPYSELKKVEPQTAWIKTDLKAFKVEVVDQPSDDDILQLNIDAQPIVDFYSR